jgi:spore coat protein JB
MMDRDEMLRELTALDFVAVDLALYLNTHNDDREALSQYNAILSKANTLRHQYESNFGPLYSYRSPSAYPWQWDKDPWPWEYDFNFMLA